MKINRRNFIKTSATAFGSAALLAQLPIGISACSNAPDSFGFQVWTIREQLFQDFTGTMKKMAEMGYSQVEMCSPLGYSSAGFEPLNNYSGTELRKMIEDQGLICNSSHYNFGELKESLENRMEWAHQIGMKQMVLASFWLPDTATVEDYRKACDDLNKIGKKTKEAGIQMVFHNHHMEFEKIGNELIYDEMLKVLDPDLVKMQFQVAVVNIGYQAADYFKRYPGRFISAHLSDYSADLNKQVPLGQGVVDWDEFFEAAKVGGVQNFFVEMAPETFEPSAQFLLEM
jgi:sugar phosphate isomerase/epimerase